MRTLLTIGIVVALGAMTSLAEARGEAADARADHARRMVRAMDDYDAQIARRQRELRKEMREMERKGRAR